MKERTLVVVMNLIEWSDIEPEKPLGAIWPVSFSPLLGQAFLPVFETTEEAEKHYPGIPRFTIKQTFKKEAGIVG